MKHPKTRLSPPSPLPPSDQTFSLPLIFLKNVFCTLYFYIIPSKPAWLLTFPKLQYNINPVNRNQ